MTSIIRDSIHVHPFWNLKEALNFVSTKLLGSTWKDEKMYVCECDSFNNIPFGCFIKYHEFGSSDSPRRAIPGMHCEQKLTFKNAIFRDAEFLTDLRQLNAVRLADTDLLLDINEDFFGIKYPTTNLLQNGMSFFKIERISEMVKAIFCPKANTDEKSADAWFYNLVESIRKHCFQRNGEDLPLWCDNLEEAQKEFLWPFYIEKRAIFCSKNKENSGDVSSLLQSFSKLWHDLRELSDWQLLDVRRVGLCFDQWKLDDRIRNIRFCVGDYAESKSSIMSEYYPPLFELKIQIKRVREILMSLPIRPKIITLARSSREGLVMRDLQGWIEHLLISAIIEVFHLSPSDVIYDERLLNGKRGDWFNRRYDLSENDTDP